MNPPLCHLQTGNKSWNRNPRSKILRPWLPEARRCRPQIHGSAACQGPEVNTNPPFFEVRFKQTKRENRLRNHNWTFSPLFFVRVCETSQVTLPAKCPDPHAQKSLSLGDRSEVEDLTFQVALQWTCGRRCLSSAGNRKGEPSPPQPLPPNRKKIAQAWESGPYLVHLTTPLDVRGQRNRLRQATRDRLDSSERWKRTSRSSSAEIGMVKQSTTVGLKKKPRGQPLYPYA